MMRSNLLYRKTKRYS